jgi:hypothetical protein
MAVLIRYPAMACHMRLHMSDSHRNARYRTRSQCKGPYASEALALAEARRTRGKSGQFDDWAEEFYGAGESSP